MYLAGSTDPSSRVTSLPSAVKQHHGRVAADVEAFTERLAARCVSVDVNRNERARFRDEVLAREDRRLHVIARRTPRGGPEQEDRLLVCLGGENAESISAVVFVLTHAIDAVICAAATGAFVAGSGDLVQAAASRHTQAQLSGLFSSAFLARMANARRAVYRRSAIAFGERQIVAERWRLGVFNLRRVIPQPYADGAFGVRLCNEALRFGVGEDTALQLEAALRVGRQVAPSIERR